MSTVSTLALQKIPGFEKTDYAYLDGNIVWAGAHATTNHPRDVYTRWQSKKNIFSADKLREGAIICKRLIEKNITDPIHSNHKNHAHHKIHAKGLLLWLTNQEMPFPLNLSATRFDAIKNALITSDLDTFLTAALRVLGLGNGLTPSGDDFVGGIFFAWAHSPKQAWVAGLSAAKKRIHDAAKVSTNVISAALLDDMMEGDSYSALHDVLIALQSTDIAKIELACKALLNIGASSGADMLAGLLLLLTTENPSPPH
jgi:hypothetical protein